MAVGSGGASTSTHSPPGPAGATIQEFVVANHRGIPSINIRARLLPVFTAEAGVASMAVDASDGCRVTSFQIAGRELLATVGAGVFDHGCFPMAPFAGRVRNGRFRFDGGAYDLERNMGEHAIHGTVAGRAWQEAGPAEWRIDLGAGWPFGGHVVHRVDLDASRLRLELEVHADTRLMPATCGWHPWWRRPVDIDVDAATVLIRDDKGIPTGERVAAPSVSADDAWDDCFTDLSGPTRVRWPNGPTITITTGCGFLVVFTEPATALCLEPQTGPPDAFTIGGAARVEPGSPLRAWVEFAW